MNSLGDGGEGRGFLGRPDPAFTGHVAGAAQRGPLGPGRVSLLPAAPGEGHAHIRAGLDPGEGATPVSKDSRTSGSFCPIPCGIKIA